MKPENQNRILIDGMDQNHSRCPYVGNQGNFSNPLSQGITGALIHGIGISIYRTLETVAKGADLTIYIILSEIERFYQRNNVYPEEVYVQLDGGSENANKYVLACLEYIVCKRLAKVDHIYIAVINHNIIIVLLLKSIITKFSNNDN